ncbi:hypothetical protein PIB30_106272, partial [Stylosanthes scabra]|nr:hypothetical protein [Stylosanthes scabra]
QAQNPRIGVKVHAYAWKAHSRPRYNVSLTRSTLITTPRTSLVTHSLAPTHVNPMLPRHSYPVLPSLTHFTLVHSPSHQASCYNMRLTLHPCLNATTTSPHIPCLPRFTPHPQPTTHAYAYNPTHMRGSTLTTSPTYPRICVTSNAYAWPTHPLPHSTLFLSITPTHMRTTLRICVELTSKTQFHTTHPRLGVLAYA